MTLPAESEVVEFVLRALSDAGGGSAVAQSLWRQAGTLRLRREQPAMTVRGKMLPLDLRSRVS